MTKNKEMLKNIEIGKVLAKLPNPTLIYGETGTGKELFAQSIIHYSGVKKSKVVVLNCAAVPENLVESILFGTKRGIYTGAENRVGLFEEADGGILFLDELNSMPYHIQAKLLRVIQDGIFRSLGDNKDKYVDVKIIGAMNIDPIVAMENNQFRKDLFYRFSSSMIRLAPLRERKEDIDLFIEYYIKYFGDLYGKKIRGITQDLREIMMEYSWEGNVRELKNTIELMIKFAENNVLLSVEYLPKYLQQRIGEAHSNLFEEKKENQELIEKEIMKDIKSDIEEKTQGSAIAYTEIINRVEKNLIQSVLDKCNGNKSKAAKMLMLPRQTLKYKLKKLHIQ
nr:sigma 54-interacting transcriptional regulator [Anaerovorax sp. IOR16]